MNAPTRPNILVILADDLGQGDVSAFNPDAAWRTPHLDALAAQGMRFTDSHATSAVCSPSRYALLTGRYNWRSRLKSSVLPGDSTSLIEHDRLTLPAFLREQGYRTGVVGKWHLGLDWTLRPDGDDPDAFGLSGTEYAELRDAGRAPSSDGCATPRFGRDGNFDPRFWPPVEGLDIDYTQPIRWGPADAGFDESFITAASLDQPPYVYIDNGVPREAPREIAGDEWKLDRITARHQDRTQRGAAVPGYDVTKVAQDFQDRALEMLDAFLGADDPWFLYVPSHLVHGPIIPNEPWRGRSGAGAYGDFVLQFDEYVGQLVARIDERGASGDTIVIVTSDNGASGVADLPRLRDEHGHDPSNGFRGHKSDIWEGGHREPTIVRWTGTVAAGAVAPQIVSHSDVFATIAEILGAALPVDAAEDSISLLDVWRGSGATPRTDVVSHAAGGGFAVRRGDWKLAFVTTGGGMDDAVRTANGAPAPEFRPAQLYDLATDPAERHNRIDEHPELVRELTELLVEQIERGRSTPGPDQENAPAPDGVWPQLAWMPQHAAR